MTHIGATCYEFTMRLLGLLARGSGGRADERCTVGYLSEPVCNSTALYLTASGKQHTKDTLASERKAGLKRDDCSGFHKETESIHSCRFEHRQSQGDCTVVQLIVYC